MTGGGTHNNNRARAETWLRSAQSDLEVARWNRQGDFHHIVCFQAQQAAEKALKAFLVAHGESNLRSHSTLELLDRCVVYGSDMEALRADCRVLDRHYLPTRYPDALPAGAPVDAYGPEDADDALARAEKVLHAVRVQLARLWGA